MSLNSTPSSSEQDHDSFLDIVANIVGILIILVMVVSMRARQAPKPNGTIVDTVPAEEALEAAAVSHVSLQKEISDLVAESNRLDDYVEVRDAERQRLCVMLSAAEEENHEKQRALSDKEARIRKLQNQIIAAEQEVENLHLEHISAIGRQSEEELEIKEITHYPTPIAKAVFGKEIHFQVQGGRVTFLPIDALFREARAQARQKVWKLDQLPEATETVGPQGGFHMRYTLEKIPLPPEVRAQTGRTGFMIRSKLWELIPTSTQLGEPLQAALSEGSRFNALLAKLDPEATTITLWTYPDSFLTYATLKQELHRLGFDAAARPLPRGVRIAGSPNGSRSTAQ